MKNVLETIQRGRRVAPRRTLIYGVHGVGKSSFAAAAPDVVFLPTEDGLDNVDCARFPLAETYAAVEQCLESLTNDEHSFAHLAVDSLDWLEPLINAETCRRHDWRDIEYPGYGKGPAAALAVWREFLDRLDTLRRRRGVAIILIAHSKIERFENPETEAYDRYVPKLAKGASALVTEWADDVLFATYETFTTKAVEGGRKRVRGVGGTERIVRTTERPSHIAKNRANLPDTIPLDWATYQKLAYQQPSTSNREEA